MHIYFSGIGGIGLSALAHMARDAGYKVSGSDVNTDTSVVQNLTARDIDISDDQSGDFLSKQHHRQPIDWFIFSGAIPSDSKERELATKLKLKQSKRDEFIHHLADKFNLKLLAVSGTHGKTTSAAMLAWSLKQQQPVSWLIGTQISFGHHGSLNPDSDWLIFEADEYDRLMLEFEPEVSLIPSIEYEHPDIYSSEEDYFAAFRQFVNQSKLAVGWLNDAQKIELPRTSNFHALDSPRLNFNDLPLLGDHNRANAELVACSLELAGLASAQSTLDKLAKFPGTARRFEKIKPNLISDYAHHPTEIMATLELADEYLAKHGFNRLVVVYQPHQDERQRSVKSAYRNCFKSVEHIYWLPTYEPPGRHSQAPLPPESLINELDNPDIAAVSDMNNELLSVIENHMENNDLVVVMGAGSVDGFVRAHFHRPA